MQAVFCCEKKPFLNNIKSRTHLTGYFRYISAICEKSRKESFFEIRINAFYFTSKALFGLELFRF